MSPLYGRGRCLLIRGRYAGARLLEMGPYSSHSFNDSLIVSLWVTISHLATPTRCTMPSINYTTLLCEKNESKKKNTYGHQFLTFVHSSTSTIKSFLFVLSVFGTYFLFENWNNTNLHFFIKLKLISLKFSEHLDGNLARVFKARRS